MNRIQITSFRNALKLGIEMFIEFVFDMGVIVTFIGGFFVIPVIFIFFLKWLFS